MLWWILRLLVILFVVRALVRLIAGVAQGLQAPSGQGRPTSTGLVRDPICGTFVVPARALALGSGSTRQFSCSERCREAFREGRREPELGGRR
jgi:hypothetical protein